MEVIKINVAKTAARAKQIELVTTGMVGASVRFSFGSEWNGLTRTAVFRAGKIAKDVALTSDTALIPPEVLAAPASLFIGVYGSNSDGTLVIPTVMVQACFVLPGADPSGDESTDPTLPVWQQLLSLIGPMDQLGTEAKDSLVAAINEIIRLAGGDIDPEVLAAAVKEYLAANPIQETDPTVPAWAKQPTKPGYTAAEVGAQPKDFVITFSGSDASNLTADKTWAETQEAWLAGCRLVGYYRGYSYQLSGFYEDEEAYFDSLEMPSLLQNRITFTYQNKARLGKHYASLNAFPVQSVNGKTGVVALTAEDVGALPSDTVIPTVPTKVSAFTNDAGYLTEVPEGYAKTTDIPTDDHINQLINTALGVIENGTY